MTTGGIEVLERVYEAWNREDVDGVVALMHPEVVVRLSGDYPGMPDELHGPDDVRRFFDLFGEAWESIGVAPERYEDAGESALALFRFVGRSHAGVTVEREGAHLVRLRDGLIAEMDVYGAWSDALGAAGLPG
jgi:ketosteroid isomerase-like protein